MPDETNQVAPEVKPKRKAKDAQDVKQETPKVTDERAKKTHYLENGGVRFDY